MSVAVVIAIFHQVNSSFTRITHPKLEEKALKPRPVDHDSGQESFERCADTDRAEAIVSPGGNAGRIISHERAEDDAEKLVLARERVSILRIKRLMSVFFMITCARQSGSPGTGRG